MLTLIITLLILAVIVIPVLAIFIGIAGPVLLIFGDVFIFVWIIVAIVKSIVKHRKK